MCSACKLAALALLSYGALAADLRVCADPGNLPYSDSQRQGFENQLAGLVGRELGRPVRYFWVSQRGKYFKALKTDVCDAVMEAPTGLDGIETTRPYYRSSYVFLSRRGGGADIRSFDDPRLRAARIGVQVLGNDDASVPPAQALAERGLMRNIAWYRVYQNSAAGKRSALVDAVQRGDVDVAIVWGPLAGYFAKRARVPMDVSPVAPQVVRNMPFAFDISMGVRPGDDKLAGQLNSILTRRATEVRAILARYGVPLVSGVR